MVISAIAHIFLSHWFNFHWVILCNGMHGGSLGISHVVRSRHRGNFGLRCGHFTNGTSTGPHGICRNRTDAGRVDHVVRD